jgi:activator of HSP90 ATPase
MPKTIMQSALLPAEPDVLFDMYLDAKEHAAFTNGVAAIDPRSGGAFSACNGMLSGNILHLEPKRLIVQTWRSGHFPKDAIDSILVLTFWPHKDGSLLELVHVNVAEEDAEAVNQGWEKYYFTPWREYILKKKTG